MTNRNKATLWNFIGLFACCAIGAVLGRLVPFDGYELALIGFMSLLFVALRIEQLYVVRDAIDRAKRVVASVIGEGEVK